MKYLGLMEATERARSLSPTKSSSNAGTPTSVRSPLVLPGQDDLNKSPAHLQESTTTRDLRMETPSNNPPSPRRFDSSGTPRVLRDSSQQSSDTVASSSMKTNYATSLSRAGTLSWQQRPSSRGSPGTRPRPLSMFAPRDSDMLDLSERVDSSVSAEKSVPRDQIARSLGAKDPSWFRQTREQGDLSATDQEQQEEDRSKTTASTSKVLLQGLSLEPRGQLPKEISPPDEGPRLVSPSPDGSVWNKSGLDPRHSTSVSLSSTAGVRSPLPTLKSQRFEPPPSDPVSSPGSERQPNRRTLAMSPSQGRISPERMERSSSPTKGLGGFVQSAMLKRSDSVSKRWSAQAGSSLSRENSIASNRSGYESSRPAGGIVNPSRDSRPGSLARDELSVFSSQKETSRDDTTSTQAGMESGRVDNLLSTAGSKTDLDEHEFFKPEQPPSKPFVSVANKHEGTDKQISDNNPPVSPSKRWSPTKASWLENAIMKPDSPKPKAPAPTQPSWMINRTKAKQDEGMDQVKDRDSNEMVPVGMLRSPPSDPSVKPRSLPTLPKTTSVVNLPEKRSKNSEIVEGNQSTVQLKKCDEPGNQSGSNQFTLSTPKRDLSPSRKETKLNHRESPMSSPVSTDYAKAEIRSRLPSTAELVPQTASQKDFRSNLKPRRASVGKDSKEEVEFKSVFGKLKRTQTQNYIAPDELKDNILRGKASLAITGGPKKTEHKDVFKESLLKQREAIKAGISPKVPPKPSSGIFSNDHKSLVPEAIVKKEDLTRSRSGLDGGESKIFPGRDNPVQKMESSIEKRQDKEEPKTHLEKQISPRQITGVANETLAESFTSSLAGLLSKGPLPLTGGVKPGVPAALHLPDEGVSSSPAAGKIQTDSPLLIHMTKSRAKGPKRRLPVVEKPSETADEGTSSSSIPVQAKLPNTPARELSKGARSSAIRDQSDPRPLATISNNNNRKPSQPLTPRKPSTNITPLITINPTSPTRESVMQGASRVSAIASPLTKLKPTISASDESALKEPKSSDQAPLVLARKPLPSSESSPKSFTYAPVQKVDHLAPGATLKTPSSSKVIATTWDKPKVSDSASPARKSSPVKIFSRRAEKSPEPEVKIVDKGPVGPIGLGIQTTSEDSQRTSPLDRNLPSPPMKSPRLSQSPKSPPLPGKKPASIGHRISSGSPLSHIISRSDNLSNLPAVPVARVLSSYVGEIPSSCSEINIDTQAVLASSSLTDCSDKIKTLRKQIWEITGHGKSIAVPTHQEHILFEDSLYLCTHVFGTINGTMTTEVYLWCGSGVAESAADDAQIFARKVAKEHNGKLLILQQGKETSKFFQALGGIVITRRGSSSHGQSPSKSGATYMLCGRRHMGQVAFDEVEYSTKSLCNAFPFLISTRFGKLYLWKGRGSGADELGCARLIGMDLGLAGEIEEIDDGQEPDVFWESLPGGRTGPGTNLQHWHLRPACERYITRLFGIEVEPSRPKSSSSFTWRRRESAPQEENPHLVARVQEIMPFVQIDMARDGVYVLDAFFEVFV